MKLNEIKQKFKFKRKSEDEFRVFVPYGNQVNGNYIGNVSKGWARLGGSGWTHNKVKSHRVFKTKQEAAENLLKIYNETK